MKNTMKMMMQWALPGLAVASCAFLSLALPGSASAQKPLFANVSADAQCTVTGTDVMVDAGLIQKDVPSSGPVVSQVVFSLELHFPNQRDWQPLAGTVVTQSGIQTFPLKPAGDRYDVATQDYVGICSQGVSPAANAVRAVVQITVDNANPKRPGGLIHTGRCISFPNPCR